MLATVSRSSALAALGRLLEYPGDDFQDRYEAALEPAQLVSPDAVAALAAFAQDVSRLSTEHAQEMYTRSFDIAPVCVPYVSVHIFGSESFKRSELMTGLIESYERVGFDRGKELPDHIALLLQCAPRFDSQEWIELVEHVLTPALKKMLAALDGANSPWRHVLRAAQFILTVEGETDGY